MHGGKEKRPVAVTAKKGKPRDVVVVRIDGVWPREVPVEGGRASCARCGSVGS